MTDVRPLTDLLGDARARIVIRLQAQPATAAALAEDLDVSPAAVRRQLGLLRDDGLVDAEAVHDGSMGRPSERWSLTRRGRRLFAERSAEFADELLDHLEAAYGRAAVGEFLRRRAERHGDRYAERLAEIDDPADRAAELARALTEDGFAARVAGGDDGRSLQLLQSHCAIQGVAEEHPEVCAHEAALFKRLLGTPDADVRVSRRDTIAAGADACVCHIDLPQKTPTPDRSA